MIIEEVVSLSTVLLRLTSSSFALGVAPLRI